jgi:MOSC domain-containing protein YiiM
MVGREFAVVSVNVGTPAPMAGENKQVISAINKQPAKLPIFLSYENLSGDAQADTVRHGGKDKAVCVYCYDHYSHWEKVLNRPLAYGAFGENLTVAGVLEEEIRVGDTFQLGEALVQVSQPRKPCHKLARKHAVADLVVQIQAKGATGFYLRVLRPGWVRLGDSLQLVERDPAGMTIAAANRIRNQAAL